MAIQFTKKEHGKGTCAFPKLMVNEHGTIVLARNPTYAIILCPPKGIFQIGAEYLDFKATSFQDYTGSVTLSNE